jgi:hypothetical protein
MMTMQLDMTAQLAAIPYGLAIALGVSFLGIVAHLSRDEVNSWVDGYRYYRTALRRRHIQIVPRLSSINGAH